MLKKIFFWGLVCVMGLSLICGCNSANKDDPSGENNNQGNYFNEGIKEPFYILQKAYDNGWLTQEDLQIIANYHNNKISYPESLSEEIAKSIKKDWAKKLRDDNTNSSEDITEDIVGIIKYYGSYHDCVVIIVDRKDAAYITIDAPYTVEIGNVAFHYNGPGPQIVVWKSENTSDEEITGQFYTVQEA